MSGATRAHDYHCRESDLHHDGATERFSLRGLYVGYARQSPGRPGCTLIRMFRWPAERTSLTTNTTIPCSIPPSLWKFFPIPREAYDRGKKFALYRQIPSLREFLLVSQHKPLIEQFIRQESGEWLLRDVAGLESKVSLASVGITIAMADVYSSVQFVPDSGRPGTPGARS